MKRVLIILGLVLAHLTPAKSRKTLIPMQPAMTHFESIGNRFLSLPEAPPWMIFFPRTEGFPPYGTLELKRKKHKPLITAIEKQKQTLATVSVDLANRLPDSSLLHAVQRQGEHGCILGACSLWLEISRR